MPRRFSGVADLPVGWHALGVSSSNTTDTALEVALPDGMTADEAVFAGIGQGWSLARCSQIARLLREPEEAVERRRVRILERVAKDLEGQSPSVRLAQWMIEATWTQAQALAASNHGAAVRVLSLKSRVLGLDKVTVSVEHSGPGAGLTPDELMAHRLKLRDQLADLPPDDATRH